MKYYLSWDIVDGYPLFYFNSGNHTYYEWFNFPKNKKIWISIIYDNVDNAINQLYISDSKNESIYKIINFITHYFDEVYDMDEPPDAEQEFILDHVQHELMYYHFVDLEFTTSMFYIMEINT